MQSSARLKYVNAMFAPSSAQPRAASIPMPWGPDAPVTTTTFPLRLRRSRSSSEVAGSLGMLNIEE